MKQRKVAKRLYRYQAYLRELGWSETGIAAYIAARRDNDYEAAFRVRLRELISDNMNPAYVEVVTNRLRQAFPQEVNCEKIPA